MSLIQINHNPTNRQLAIFAIAWCLSLGIVGWILPAEVGKFPLRRLLWFLAVVVPVFGLGVPGFLRGAYLASAYAALPIGVLMSYLMLGVLYYLVVTPIGVALRLAGHDPLGRRLESNRESYWIARKSSEAADRYFEQF